MKYLVQNRFQKLKNDLESISRVFREFQKFKNESIRTSGQHVYFVVLRFQNNSKQQQKHHTTAKNETYKTETYGRVLVWALGLLGDGVLGVGFAVRWLGWVFGWVLAWSGLGGRVVAWMGVRLGWVFGCWAFFFWKNWFHFFRFNPNKKQKTQN